MCAAQDWERPAQRAGARSSTQKPETLSSWGRLGLGAGAQASEVGSWGEDDSQHTLRKVAASIPTKLHAKKKEIKPTQATQRHCHI